MMKISLIAAFFATAVLAAPDGGYPLGRKEYYIKTPIDHFANGGSGSPTFNMRYFVDA